jgi:hypothetical protein
MLRDEGGQGAECKENVHRIGSCPSQSWCLQTTITQRSVVFVLLLSMAFLASWSVVRWSLSETRCSCARLPSAPALSKPAEGLPSQGTELAE